MTTIAPSEHAQDDTRDDRGNHRRGWSTWTIALVMLAVAALAFVKLVQFELGPNSARFLQIDEVYFSSCAAHAVAAEQILPAGCHDQKAPLVMAVHQLVQQLSAAYDTRALKVAAFSVVVLVVVVTAALSGLIAGWPAALVSASLLLLAFTYSPAHMALKTETVGSVFLLSSLLAWLQAGRAGSTSLSFIAGALAGAAVLTKQTYVIAAVASLVWLVWISPHGRRASWLNALAYVAGALVVFLVLLACFFAQGSVEEFLAGTALYPTVYGAADAALPFDRWRWTFIAVVDQLAGKQLLTTLFAVGVVMHCAGAKKERDPGVSLVLVISAAMASVLFLSPVFYTYHIAALTPVLAVVAGIAVARAARTAPLLGQRYLVVGLLVPTLLMGAHMWNLKLGVTDDQAHPYALRQPAVAGSHGYVLGMFPEFYSDNGLVPASSVMFPWALPGAPPNPLYRPPEGHGLKARLFARAQAHGLERLWSDFRQRPPHYIAVVHRLARAPGSSARVSDVPGFDAYLEAHCQVQQEMDQQQFGPATIFRCNQH